MQRQASVAPARLLPPVCLGRRRRGASTGADSSTALCSHGQNRVPPTRLLFASTSARPCNSGGVPESLLERRIAVDGAACRSARRAHTLSGAVTTQRLPGTSRTDSGIRRATACSRVRATSDRQRAATRSRRTAGWVVSRLRRRGRCVHPPRRGAARDASDRAGLTNCVHRSPPVARRHGSVRSRRDAGHTLVGHRAIRRCVAQGRHD